MEVSAKAKFARISPKKVRPLLKPLKNMGVTNALNHLKFHKSKSAVIIYKLVKSALSNAQNNYNLKENNLKIKNITVDSGPTFKRYWFRSRGNADQLRKRSSHFSVILAEINPTIVKKKVEKSMATTVAPAKSETSTNPIDKSQDVPTTSKTNIQDNQPATKRTGLQNIFKRRTTNK